MYSTDAQWYTEKQTKRSGDDYDTHCKKRGDTTMMRSALIRLANEARQLAPHAQARRKETVRLPRWLFLLWSVLVYAWGLLGYFGAGWGNDCHRIWGVAQACYTTFFPALNASSFQFKVGPDFSALLIFTVCMALPCFLCWVVLSTKIERRLYWLACLLQGGLVLVAKLAIQGDVVAFGDGIALALYVGLCVQALLVLKQLRPVLLAAAGYLLLFSLGASLEGGWQYLWQARLPFIGYSILIPLLVTLVAFYLMHIHAHNRLAMAHRQLEAAYEQLAASTRQIESLTLLTERQRIARDLHDTLSQDLVGLIRQLDIVEAHLKLQHGERALTIVQDAAQSARSALTGARWTIENLRTMTADVACAEALLKEIEHFQAATSIACESDLTALSGLPESVSDQVQHLVREGLTNIARHAQAHHVWIRTREDQDGLEIEVGDDGVGFDLATVEGQSGHYGLLGLRERARLLGGAAEIRSIAGEGTVLSFSLPNLKRREETLDEYSKQGHPSRDC
jgi:two-component system, NarL family, sensor histidine kinase YdfH